MAEQTYEQLNRFLVDVFHEILKTEETCLAHSGLKDLSIREIHVIEEVCLAISNQTDNRATAIAAGQRITAGTLTTTVVQLEKKGYLIRKQDDHDKRIIRIFPTEKGLHANQLHNTFHQEMVEDILQVLSPAEAEAFSVGLDHIQKFFEKKYKKRMEKK